MNITLLIDGEKKTFTQFFIPAKFLRKALELRKDISLLDLKPEELDIVVNFVVEVFDNKFTADQVWEGISYHEIVDVIFNDIFIYILTGQKKEETSDSEEKK